LFRFDNVCAIDKAYAIGRNTDLREKMADKH